MRYMALLLLLTALASFLGLVPFSSMEISSLQPAELLVITPVDGGVTLRTEDALTAWGRDLEEAFQNLKAAAPGKILFSTVSQLVCVGEVPDPKTLTDCGLRPATAVYRSPEVEDVKALRKYLASREGMVTLGMLRDGEQADVPQLRVGKSGLYLP